MAGDQTATFDDLQNIAGSVLKNTLPYTNVIKNTN